MSPGLSSACPNLARFPELNVRLHPQIVVIPKKDFKSDYDTESEDELDVGGRTYYYGVEESP